MLNEHNAFEATLDRFSKQVRAYACLNDPKIIEEQFGIGLSHCDLSLLDANNNNLLHAAIFKNDYWTCYYLIERGIALNHVNNDGLTPIALATKLKMTNVRLLLLGYPVQIDKSKKITWISNLLFSAMDYEDNHLITAIFECLSLSENLENQHDIKQAVLERYNASGLTVLHVATQKNNWSLVETLIKSGAGTVINVANSENNTPLHIACRLGYSKIAKLLLKNGADLTKRNNLNYTPLSLAVIWHHTYQTLSYPQKVEEFEQVIRQLLKSGAALCSNLYYFPSSINLDNMLVIGLNINGNPVSRQMKGFEKAITSLDELKQAPLIYKAYMDRDYLVSLFYICSNKSEKNNQTRLEVLKSILRGSFVECCLGFFAQKRYKGYHSKLTKIIPQELSDKLLERLSESDSHARFSL